MSSTRYCGCWSRVCGWSSELSGLARIIVRAARPEDVAAMSAVLCASIRQLCGADHLEDETVIAAWTRNKTPSSIRQWLDDPQITLFVAERHDAVAAVGAIGGNDKIILNYVAPAHRFAGVSKALLRELEQEMVQRGIVEGNLVSTATARRFYRDAGWRDCGPVEAGHAVDGFPMRKVLAVS